MVVEVIGDGIKKSLKGSAKESNKITGADIDEKITGGNLSDTLLAGAGNDVVKAQGGNDYIEGGKGNDKLYGVSGDNKFSFAVGDGKDTIFAGKGSDTVELKSVNASKLELVSTDSKNVILKYSDSDDITLNKYYSKNSVKKVIVNGTTTTWENFINDYAKYGNIVLTGNGKGKVNGTKFDDYISASEEGVTNNKITGGKGNDTIFGNSGNDTIKGGVGNDIINGGKGADMLYGEKDNNKFVFTMGDGSDTITSGKGIDTIKFEDFAGDVNFSQGEGKNNKDLVITYNDGQDSITVKKYFVLKKGEIVGVKSSVQKIEAFGKTYDLKNYASENGLNTLTIQMNYSGDSSDETIYGSKYDDTIRGGGGNDYIDGGEGNDLLKGDAGNDTIYGGIGNDTIYGGAGNDSISGGAGHDVLYSDSGNNVFMYDAMDAIDTIYSGTGSDTIYVNSNYGYYSQEKIGDDLIVYYNPYYTNVNGIVLKDYFKNGVNHSVQHINDQRNYNYEIANQNMIIKGSGVINGTKYSDRISGSSGADTITAGQVNREGAVDQILQNPGNDVIYVQQDGSLYIYTYNGNGNDTIMRAANARAITLYHSNDATVYGYQNGNNYVLVREYYTNGVLQTEQTTIKDFKLSEHPDIIKVNRNSTTSDLSAFDIGEFDPATTTLLRVDNNTRTLEDSSGDKLLVLGTAGNDTISTGAGDDKIMAGEGYNSISSSDGNNVITSGAGSDTITVNGSGDNRIAAGAGNDTITVNSSGDNYIEVSSGYNKINVNGSGNNTIDGGSYADTININDGVNTVISDGGSDVININGGSTTIDATAANSNYIQANVTAGNVTVMSAYDSSQSVFTRVNGDSDAIKVTGSDKKEYVEINSGANNKVELLGGTDSVSIYGGDNNRVWTGYGSDSINVYGGTNMVNAGADNDYISLTNNPSTSTIYGGDGYDVITVDSSVGETNAVTIYGGRNSDGADSDTNRITIYGGSAEVHTGNKGDYISATYSDVVGVDVYGGSGSDTIYGSYNADYIRGGAGDDTIYGQGGADTISTGAGDDYIGSNSNGAETFVFNKGDGNDSIGSLYSLGDYVDTINFADSNLDELTVDVQDNDVIIKYNGGADSVRLYGVVYYYGSTLSSTIDKVVTADNAEGIDLLTLVNTRSIYDMNDTIMFEPDTETGGAYFEGSRFSDYIIGTNNNDTIQGYWTPQAYGDDTIETGAGDDSISMRYGNNTFIGGVGNDTIYMDNFGDYDGNPCTNTAIFSTGDGMDVINGLASTSILKFDIENLNDISISNFFDDNSDGRLRTLIKYNDVDTDGIVINSESITYDMKQAQIGLVSGGGTQTIYDLLNDSHVYLARSTYNRTLLNNLDDYTEEYLAAYADNESGSDETIYISTTDEADYIYTTGWSNKIEGGKGNDTIDAIGNIGDDGRITNVGYIDYVINIDAEGNGDGVDTILNDYVWGYNKIIVKGVGTDVDDRAAQQAFIDSLRCSFNGDDLIIEYGNDNSKLIFKNAKADLSGISTNQFVFVYPDESGKYNLSDYDTYSGYWDLSSNMFVPVNVSTDTHEYEATPYYSERINGTNGDDTITLNGQYKVVTPKKGADVIKIKSAENNGEYTLNMGTDNVADVIWFEDVTDIDNILIGRVEARDENGNMMYDSEGHTIYTDDLYIADREHWNAHVTIKDYFTYAQNEHIPTFMQIKIGDGTEANTFKISDLYRESMYNTEGLPTVTGTVFNDSIYTSNDVAEVVNAGGGNDTIHNNSGYYDYDAGTTVYVDPMADTVHGGSGKDSISYTYHDNPNVEIWGDAGNDTIALSAGKAHGGKGSDDIYVSSYSVYDSLTGTYTYHYNDVTMYGYEWGDDADDIGNSRDTLQGGGGNDHIYGSKGHDSISGGDGNDYINGFAGNDIIEAGSGLDTVYGHDGNDLIFSSYRPWNYQDYESIGGGAGYAYESYHGDSGNALLYGGDGNDTIIAQGTNHTITGGEGNDLIVTTSYYSSTVNELHFESGDGHDTIYGSRWASNNAINDTIIFSDVSFDYYYNEVLFDEANNQLIINYNYDGGSDTWGSSITIKNYLSDSSFANQDYTSLSNLNSSIDKIIDCDGYEYSIRDMIEWNMGTVTTYQGTFFSDTATLSTDVNYFNGYYGSDTITGNSNNNRLFGYNESYRFGVEGDGDDYIDGALGANELYGGWGDDTLVGGGDDEIDTLYGGYGDNRYIINPVYNLDDTIAEIHSSSDQDTIALSSGVATWYSKDGNNLLLNYSGPDATNHEDNTVILKDWYLNPRDFSIVIGNGWNGMYSLMNSWAFSNGVEFGTTNTSSAKLYLGTSDDDEMNVAYGTTVSGGQGDDSITAHYEASTIYGGLGNDSIYGSQEADVIYGGDGSDSIEGGAGADVIYTANKPEDEFDMAGNYSYRDSVERLVGVNDDWDNCDKVYGGTGNDTIFAAGENAYLYGETGNDTYHVTLSNYTFITDWSGNNVLNLHTFNTYGEDAYIAMDVNSDGTFNDNGVMIMSKDAFQYWLDNNGYNMDQCSSGFVSLGNDSSNQTYQHMSIRDASGYYMDTETVNSLKSEIVSWLSTEGYGNVSDSMDETSYIKDLLVAFNDSRGYSASDYNWHSEEV